MKKQKLALCVVCLQKASVTVRNTKKTLSFCDKHWEEKRGPLERGHGYKIVKGG